MMAKTRKNQNKMSGLRWANIFLALGLLAGMLFAQAPRPALAATVLSASFDADANGFTYADDTFRNTTKPGYAAGSWLAGGGFAGGGLQVSLGGLDAASVYGLSGGWKSSFFLGQATTVTLSIRYKLTLSADGDTTDFSQVFLSVDGVRRGSGSNTYVAQLTGDGDGGSDQTTGWQQFQVSLGALPAGIHELVVGGYLNQKTGASEWAEVLVDDVIVDGTASSATERIDYGTAVAGYHGAVATGGSGARSTTTAGIRILKEGGNAFDAAAAMILALTTNDSGMVCFGGEVPIITYNKGLDQVKVISGQGPAPASGTLAYFKSIGGIPSGTNIKNAAVPGLLLGVLTMLKEHGSMTFEQVADPFLDLLAGQTGWRADLRSRLQQMITADVNARSSGGSRLDGLTAVRDLFYSGAIADEIDARSVAQGGLIRKSDLVAYGGSWAPIEDPLNIDYKGYTVYKVDAWTQGPYAMETLQILEGMELQAMGHLKADYIHSVVEALKLGLADRDEYLADPAFVPVPLPNMISQEYGDLRRALINMGSASQVQQPGDPWNMQPLATTSAIDNPSGETGVSRDTSTVVTADRWGNVVVATPSGWGGVLLSGTGIYLGNRLRSFNTWEGHPNVVAPGKRPRITLTPGLIFKDGRPYIGISVAGTDKQDQTFVNIFLNAVEFGFSAAESVSLPRFGTDHFVGSFSQPAPSLGSLTVNTSIPTSVRTDLTNRGHKVSTTSDAYAWPNMIIFHENGLFEAAGDPNASRDAGVYTDLTAVIANNPPSADSQSLSTLRDTPVGITLSGTDPDGDPLTYSLVTLPGHGSLSGNPPSLTYTPASGYSGPDSFTFKVNDGLVDSSPGTVSINVTRPNTAPVANSQSVSTNEDTAKGITLSGSDADGDPLTYQVTQNPAHGSLSGTKPNLTYTPAANYHGPDSFTFKVNDGQVDSAPATVSITVIAVNDAPAASAQSLSTSCNTPKAITLAGSDIDGDNLTFLVGTGPAHGSLTGTAPALTYTPGTGYSGADSFTFTAYDGQLSSAPASVSITIGSCSALFLPYLENFESGGGWTPNPQGTDSAGRGKWERAGPQATELDGPKQLDEAASGSYALVTGAAAGSNPGSDDVDGGVTSIRSPEIQLPTGQDITLSIKVYFAHSRNASLADFLRLKVVGESTQAVLSLQGSNTDVDAAWRSFSASLNPFAGQTVYLLLEAADLERESLVEAALDDVSITAEASAAPILSESFDSNAGAFTYQDDAFRGTSQPGYASGVYQAGGGFSGGGLQISLGGIDNAIVQGISGGWQTSFNLSAAAPVAVSFWYRLSQSGDYEDNELSQALLSVDGLLYGAGANDYVFQLNGNGNGGGEETSGWQVFTVNLGTLSAGSHSLRIGGYNNRKSMDNEWSEIWIDRVLVIAPP